MHYSGNMIPINPDLVAVVGNKGKGKSALTDIIGLLCNTKQHRDFTFLSPDNFRQAKENKARHFQATLTWESGTTITKGLDEAVNEQQPELVKYIPQNFLEKICTQLGKIEESDFDRELKKVIFSHVDPANRIGTASLDELVAYKASEANKTILLLKQELHRINEEVTKLEERSQPEYRQKIQNLHAVKRNELEAHEKSKPAEVPKPETNPVRQAEISKVTTDVETAKRELAECESQISSASEEQGRLVLLISTFDRLLARLENFDRQVQTFAEESKTELENIGLSLDAVLQVMIKKQPLIEKRKSFVDRKETIDEQLDASRPGSLLRKKQQIQAQVEELQARLDEPNKKYQAYESDLRIWEKRTDEIAGGRDIVGTLKYYEGQLEDLKKIPRQFMDALNRQLLKAKEIYSVIGQLANTYRELYAPVNQFIEGRPLAKEKFQLNFEVGIVDTGFADGEMGYTQDGRSPVWGYPRGFRGDHAR